MSRRVRDYDWARTPLGPIEGWPQSLRTSVDLMLAHAFPMAVLWGPESINLYNDAYIPILAAKHPATLGRPQHEVWPELRDTNEPFIRRAWGGETVSLKDVHFASTRNGAIEDSWSDLSLSPLRDDAGRIAGALATVFETTDRVLAQRMRDRIEGELREKEARLRALVSAGANMIYRMSPDWRVMYQLNGRDLLADTPDPIENWADAYLLPEDRPAIFAAVEEAIRTRSMFDLEHRVATADGGVGWVRSRAVPIRGPDGEIVEWFGIGSDIDVRKRAEEALRASEERQAFLLKLSDLLRPLGDPVEIMAVASQALGRHLGVGRSGYGEVDATGEFFVVERDWTDGVMASFKGKHRLAGFGPKFTEACRAGQSVLIEDALADARAAGAEAAFEAAGGVRASLGLPLIKDGRFIAGLFAQQLQPRRWTAKDEALARDVAERTWAAVERARAEDALRESEQRYRTASRIGRTGSWETDFTTGVRHWSPEAMELFGLDLPDGVGKVGGDGDEWRASLHPGDAAVPALVYGGLAAEDRIQVEYRISRPDGRIVWLLGHAEVIARDAAGRVARLVNVAADVTESRLAQETLREREKELARVQRIGRVGGMEVDLCEGFRNRRSPEYLRLHGLPPESAEEPHEDWRARLHPDDRGETERRFLDAVASGATEYEGEYRIVRPSDGALRWIAARGEIERDANGRALRLVGAHIDVTERKLAEAASRESEERFRSFAEASADTLWIVDAETRRLEYLSPAFERMWGEPRDAVLADLGRWRELVHPDDREAAGQALPRALAGEDFVAEYRIVRPSDGAVVFIRDTGFPMRDVAGRIRRIGGIAQDVTSERRSAEHQATLLAELQHRVRNTLAVIRAIARRTATSSETVEDYAFELDGRLNAFARVQAAVTRNPTSGIDLATLVADELRAHTAREGDGVRILGPAIRLQPKAAETFGLAFHELATNAVKHGALATQGGRIRVTWRREDDGDPRLALTWKESGVSPATLTPDRRGFGTDLLLRTLAYELKAKVQHVIEPDGLRYTVELPLTGKVVMDNRVADRSSRARASMGLVEP